MAKEKSQKSLIGIIAAVCVVVVAIIVTVVVVNNSSKNGSGSESSETSSAVVTASELSGAVDASVMYGDFDGMQALSKDIQNGRMTGKIVSIDGLVNHPGSAYSVVEPSSDGTTKIGTVFIIDGSAEYPADGVRISIVAKVVEVSPMNFQLVTLKEYVQEK